MDTNFRMKYCRFCNNRKLDLQTGVQCGLESTPDITNDHCPNFSLDNEERGRIKSIRKKSNDEEIKTSFINFWNVSTFIVPLIVGAIAMFKYQELNEEYRWTIGTTYESSEDFSIVDPLSFDSFLYYTYKVNNQVFHGKVEVDFEISEIKSHNYNYFVRYNPSNPENSEIDHFKMIPYFINLKDVPSNGISSDSVKYFVKDQLDKRKQKNNLP